MHPTEAVILQKLGARVYVVYLFRDCADIQKLGEGEMCTLSLEGSVMVALALKAGQCCVESC